MPPRGKKVVNYMEHPQKKKRKPCEVEAYTFGTTLKGRLTSKKIATVPVDVRDTTDDELGDNPPTTEAQFTDDISSANDYDMELSRQEMYATKSKGRGSVHVRHLCDILSKYRLTKY